MDYMGKIYDVFQSGGPVMWPLLACSLIALTFAIERILYMWRLELGENDALFDRVLKLAERGEFDKAVNEGGKSRDPAVRVVVAGLVHREHGLSDAMQMEAEKEVDRMKHGLSVLDTCITMAPLLGILGTVTGIIKSFNLLNASGMQDPKMAMGGLAEALITTAAGLIIALMTLIPFNYLTAKVRKISRRVEHGATHMEVACRRSQGQDKGAP